MYRIRCRRFNSKPFKHPRRPPDRIATANTRFFARNAQLLLVSHHSPRPQPSFLAPLSSGSRTGRWQPARWLTTEKKEEYKDQFRRAIRFNIIAYSIIGFGLVMTYAIIQDVLEAEKPTPQEWTFFSRTKLRSAYGNLTQDANSMGFTDFALVGSLYRKLLERLEDPNIDGAGLVEQEEGGIDTQGAGRAGFDITSKSDAWRAGYFECLMGCAKAAEHLDGQVVIVKSNKVLPAHYVPGPSNPNPKPMPPWRGSSPPHEDEVAPASLPPEHFYVQILTTKGFTTKERMDAAIAYGEWLDFKQLYEAAEEAYRWALDIATENIPNASTIINPLTGILRSGSDSVSTNILTATTALATHYALESRASDALPIYLSVLRARRNAPEGLPLPNLAAQDGNTYDNRPATDIEAIGRWFRYFASLFKEKPFPIPATTGDEPFMRRSGDADGCEDAKIMAYIGEILFASAPSEKAQNDAIRWTRDAVEISDRGLQSTRLQKAERLKCLDCKSVALDNWFTMAKRMSEAERQRRLAGTTQRKGWFEFASAQPATPESAIEEQGGGRRGPWRCQEEKDAELKFQQHLRQGMREKLTQTPFTAVWSKIGFLMQI
ncbi:hypothetical protein NA57DRAFT_51556 [Rhizodiscina lignyota]|uniref:MFS maltose permease n=1 Tax=Rhizodiscina lignyota TaxID=1504668 RepID=A0A9P4INH6_9PEZI|nr:hypothetical protein NA57DRAFT_51556 [Rhizodiscina lignyota]